MPINTEPAIIASCETRAARALDPVDEPRILHQPDGPAIAYRCWRAKTRSPKLIVLIHGMASNMTRWSEFVRHTTLRNSWDIVRLDLRGHAGSHVRSRLSMRTWCDDVAAILEAEHHAGAVLIGHCLGANIALNFSTLFPEKTAGLVLIEPLLPGAITGSLKTIAALRPAIVALRSVVRALNHLGIHRGSLQQIDLEELDRFTRAAMAAEAGTKSLTKRYASPLKDLRIMSSANYLDDLLAVTGPMPSFAAVLAPSLALLSTGAHFSDPVRTRFFLTQLRNCRVLTLPSHHWIPTETPDAMRQAIESWCDGLASG
ncbi:MAG: alpha/beta fold hydrolase [Acidiferrobacterales bacterium]